MDCPDHPPLKAACATLREALARPPSNLLERDGVIQRFEYTFELAWKAMRKHLLWLGRADVSGSPKPVIREALGEGLIDVVEEWFAYVEARNQTSHTYQASVANEIFAVIAPFCTSTERLIERLERA